MQATRCPNCSALVSEDAEWCGQCFTSLRVAPAPASPTLPAPTRTPGPATAGGDGSVVATWPCPTCGAQNPIELDVCAVCGTSFAQLLRQEELRPSISPRDAFVWSLTFPGLGHAKAGRGPDGIARATLFVLTFGLALIIVISGVHSAPVLGVVALLLVSALTVYLGSAVEAYRIASGEAPLVSARALLWATVALIMVSVALLSLSVVGVAGQ
jgi:ribosomal protein L40E